MDILDNKYFVAFFITFTIMYFPLIRPELPSYIKNLFNNPIFRLVVLFLIVVKANKDPSLALMIAIVFVAITNCLAQQQAVEAFQSTSYKDKK
jgi:O-antigen ligase